MSGQSVNQATIASLVESLQKKVEPPKLYEALRRISLDLAQCYDALFFGPLPAVSGENLTDLNALELVGIVPEENLPANLAFQDRVNIFNETNDFVFDGDLNDKDELDSIRVGFGVLDDNGDDTRTDTEIESWFRIGIIQDKEFFISQNFKRDETEYLRDDETLDGLILEFIDGELNFKWWAPADAFDYPDPYLADTWAIKGKGLWMTTYEQDDEMNIIYVDPHWDIIYLADSAGSFTDDWKGFLAIPNKQNVDLPVIDAAEPGRLDGIIAIDKTNNRLVYYTGGSRFRLAGVAF